MSLTDIFSILGSLVTILVAAVTAIYFLRTGNPDMKEIIRTCLIALVICILIITGGVYGLHAAFPSGPTAGSTPSTNSTVPPATTGSPNPTVQVPSSTPSVGSGVSPGSNPYAANMQKLVLNDQLQGPNSTNASQWENDGSPTPTLSGQGSSFCGIAADGAYHASYISPNDTFATDFTLCPALKTNFMNFTYEVQMQIIGELQNPQSSGGIFFRETTSQNEYSMYIWTMQENGSPTFTVYRTTQSPSPLSDSVPIPSFDRGFNQTNKLAVVANGTQLEFYVNGRRITTVTSEDFTFGSIGVIGGNNSDVVFSNAKVWTA